jgi:hypothetical protein
MRVELPGGHSAELRDPSDVRRGDVRAVAAAADKDMAVSGDGQQVQAAGVMLGTATMQDALVVRFVTSWTLRADGPGNDEGEPLPVTLDVVQDLPLKYYKPLAAPLTGVLAEIMGVGDQAANGQPDPLSAARSSRSASTG